MERQRREEWERGKKEELGRRREGEQEEISRLRAKKKSLELELEAVVRPHYAWHVCTLTNVRC